MFRLERELIRYRVAVMVVGTLCLFVLVMVPLSIGNVIANLIGGADGPIYPIPDSRVPSVLGPMRFNEARPAGI